MPDLFGVLADRRARRRADERLDDRAARSAVADVGPRARSTTLGLPRRTPARPRRAGRRRSGRSCPTVAADDRAAGEHRRHATSGRTTPRRRSSPSRPTGDAFAYISCGTWALVGRRARAPGPDRGEPRRELHERGRRRRPDPLPAQRHGPVAAPGVAADLGAGGRRRRTSTALLAAAAALPAGGPTSTPTTRRSSPRATCRRGSRVACAGGRRSRPAATRPELVRCILDSLAAAFARAVERRRAAVRPDDRGRPPRRRRGPQRPALPAHRRRLRAAGRRRAGRGDGDRQRPRPGPRARARRRATWSAARAGPGDAADSAATSRADRAPRIGRLSPCGSRCSSPASTTCCSPTSARPSSAAAAARPRGRVPRGPDLLRPDALQHRLPRCLRAAGPALRERLRGLRRRRHAVAVVRRDGPRTTIATVAARRRRSRRSPASARGGRRRAVHELTEFLVDVARRDRRRRALPARGRVPPDVPLAAAAADRRPAAAPARGGRRACASWTSPGADECCGFGGTFAVKNADTSLAMGADKLAAVAATGAEVAHRGGHLVPACTSAACCRAPARRSGPMHLAEILAEARA